MYGYMHGSFTVQISSTAFDVNCSMSGRSYHLSDQHAGSQMWIELIGAMHEKMVDLNREGGVTG